MINKRNTSNGTKDTIGIKEIGYRIYSKFLDMLTIRDRLYLEEKNIYQREIFNNCVNDLKEVYPDLEGHNISRFMISQWDIYNNKMRDSLFNLDFHFLRNEVIKKSIFVNSRGKLLKHELNFLENNVEKKYLKFLLEEESIGDPILLNSNYRTSHNTVHNLYHLVYFSKQMNKDLDNFEQIVEWGGGYGNLARLFTKMYPEKTYIIIDTPLFSCIQWIYLCSVFGKDKINLIKNKKDIIEKGKINILPLCFIEEFDLNVDLFISTWALNESSVYSQEYVKNKNFFNAKNFLIAIGEQIKRIPNSHYLIDFYKKYGFLIQDIKFINGSRYIFK